MFRINVAVPRPGENFWEHVDVLKSLECIYIPERKCWVGEFDGELFSDEVQVIGQFVTESLRGMSRELIIAAIDQCADFKAVGR